MFIKMALCMILFFGSSFSQNQAKKEGYKLKDPIHDYGVTRDSLVFGGIPKDIFKTRVLMGSNTQFKKDFILKHAGNDFLSPSLSNAKNSFFNVVECNPKIIQFSKKPSGLGLYNFLDFKGSLRINKQNIQLEKGDSNSSDFRKNVPFYYHYLGGLLGGTVGFFGGLIVWGELVYKNGHYEMGRYDILYGGIIGEVVLSTMAIYLINNKSGNIFYDYLTSIAIGTLGLAVLNQNPNIETLIAIPLIQVGTTVAVDRIF